MSTVENPTEESKEIVREYIGSMKEEIKYLKSQVTWWKRRFIWIMIAFITSLGGATYLGIT